VAAGDIDPVHRLDDPPQPRLVFGDAGTPSEGFRGSSVSALQRGRHGERLRRIVTFEAPLRSRGFALVKSFEVYRRATRS